ncbi:MAG: hypothetical protein JSV19_04275 [Phycisphaerales bacterium]|nr:MAG: hypothetical protein JSV19_04275 [Phycisphaerales bacterium]
MIERVEQLPEPEPDMNRLLTALGRGQPDRVPLIELAVDPEIIGMLRDGSPLQWDDSFDEKRARVFGREHNTFWHRLGYDYVRVSPRVRFDLTRVTTDDTADLGRGRREWADSAHGAVQSMDDVERYPWPTLTDDDFKSARAVIDQLPDGMGAIGFSGGVFEFSSQLVGIEKFLMGIYMDPDFIQTVIDRVGAFIGDTFKTFCGMGPVKAVWLGDDLGSKNATMVDPAFLRRTVFPWYRRYAELAHEAGRLFLLHSCGNLTAIMDDLVELGVDAKHSFEDAIMPVEQVKQRWGDRLAILGGVDVDILSRGSEQQVRDRTEAILHSCAPGGGFACGSGNSIANYVKPENYLAMLETVHRFNGRM